MALPRLTGSLAGRTGHPRWRGTYTGALHLSRPKAGVAGARASACRHIRHRTQSPDITWNSSVRAVTWRARGCGWRSTPRSRSRAPRLRGRHRHRPDRPCPPDGHRPRPAAHRVAPQVPDPRGPRVSRRRRRLTPARSFRTPARTCPTPFPDAAFRTTSAFPARPSKEEYLRNEEEPGARPAETGETTRSLRPPTVPISPLGTGAGRAISLLM